MKAVVLLNLGGPTTREAIEPFLYNLFRDPDVIRLPFFLRPFQDFLARRIARKRTPESAANYDLIGGSSPLLKNTELQAKALEEALGPEYRVLTCMRYWHPRADEVVTQLRELQPEEIFLLPLYPQYSISTTLSSFNDFERVMEAADWDFPLTRIGYFFDRPAYADAVADTVRGALGDCVLEDTHLLFSAHGVPVSYVDKFGDPYRDHV